MKFIRKYSITYMLNGSIISTEVEGTSKIDAIRQVKSLIGITRNFIIDISEL